MPALLAADPELLLRLYCVFLRDRERVMAAHDWPNPARASRHSAPIPARAVGWMGRVWPSVGRQFLGEFDVFHDTDYAVTPVRGRPRVVTLYDTAYLRERGFVSPEQAKKMTGIVRRLLLGDPHIITISEFARDEIVEAFQVDPSRITVAPLGVDPVFRKREDPARTLELRARLGLELPYVMYIGTLEPRKNLVRLVRAFARLLEVAPEHELVLVGRAGHAHARVLEEIETLGLTSAVKWLGPRPDEETAALLQAATCLAYPSLYEGFGLPALEGMASGVPVLTAKTTALSEVCGEGALLVDPTSESEIFEGLKLLCLDRSEALEIAERGVRRASGYTWEACAQKTLEAYRRARS